MNDAASGNGSFIRQRRAGMAAIAASLPVALLLWLAIAYLMPPLTGMDSLGDRMLLTLKCCCLAVLFCLVTGVEAVAHERLFSPAFDPLAGFENAAAARQSTLSAKHNGAIPCVCSRAFWPGGLFPRWFRDASRPRNHYCLDNGAFRFLGRLSSGRRNAGSRCAGHGAQHGCPALCGRSNRFRSWRLRWRGDPCGGVFSH